MDRKAHLSSAARTICPQIAGFGCTFLLPLYSFLPGLHKILCTRIIGSHTCTLDSQTYRISLGYSSLLGTPWMLTRLVSAESILACVYNRGNIPPQLFLPLSLYITLLIFFLSLFWVFHILLVVCTLVQILCGIYNSIWYELNFPHPFLFSFIGSGAIWECNTSIIGEFFICV